MNVKTVIIRIISLAAIIATCVTIFMFSSQPAEESKDTSNKVVEFVEKTEPIKHILPEKQSDKVNYIRKYAHVFWYCVLGISVSIFAFTFKDGKWLRPALSVAFCMLYSCSDEFHQRFVEGRAGELRDLAIDAAGYLTGIVIVSAVYYIIQNKKLRRNIL